MLLSDELIKDEVVTALKLLRPYGIFSEIGKTVLIFISAGL